MSPIADMLTQIRNAQLVKKDTVRLPFSRFKSELARVLKEEGFIKDVASRGTGTHKQLVITLKYIDGVSAIHGLKSLSRPSQKLYTKRVVMPRSIRGGIIIISTSRGLLTAKDARKVGVGGVLVCEVW